MSEAIKQLGRIAAEKLKGLEKLIDSKEGEYEALVVEVKKDGKWVPAVNDPKRVCADLQRCFPKAEYRTTMYHRIPCGLDAKIKELEEKLETSRVGRNEWKEGFSSVNAERVKLQKDLDEAYAKTARESDKKYTKEIKISGYSMTRSYWNCLDCNTDNNIENTKCCKCGYYRADLYENEGEQDV